MQAHGSNSDAFVFGLFPPRWNESSRKEEVNLLRAVARRQVTREELSDLSRFVPGLLGQFPLCAGEGALTRFQRSCRDLDQMPTRRGSVLLRDQDSLAIQNGKDGDGPWMLDDLSSRLSAASQPDLGNSQLQQSSAVRVTCVRDQLVHGDLWRVLCRLDIGAIIWSAL